VLDVNRMAIAPESGRSIASGDGADTVSDLSLVLDSSGNQAVCLRNQPRLPKTAFLSSTPSMLTQFMGSDGPLSTHTTPRSIGDMMGLLNQDPGGSMIRGSSAFDSALRSDEEHPSAQVRAPHSRFFCFSSFLAFFFLFSAMTHRQCATGQCKAQ
jgi:hypothetical protein